jgi:3-dehydroquinate synthase
MEVQVQVELGDRSYPIAIGNGLLAALGARCRERGARDRCLVVSDSNVEPLYGRRAVDALEQAGIAASTAVIPAGEPSKSGAELARLYEEAVRTGLDRRAFVVALGGGVVGDLAGFLAATLFRGIACVQAPTTIVAMVDSAVGGKTGINLSQGKNLVGSFWQPAAVVADLDTLATLPDREFRSGLAEVVKYGVIRDAALFDWLEAEADRILARDPDCLARMIARACEIKADVVRCDEREGGLRAILNFGHTLAHAVEKAASYGTYLHGEAVAVGMVYAARLSVLERGLEPAAPARLRTLLRRLDLPVSAPDCPWETLRQAMGVDKKSVGRSPRFVLADRLGNAVFGCPVPESRLEEVWHGLGE